jgi:sensor c-di-GMP phosphodiesterase-like protein
VDALGNPTDFHLTPGQAHDLEGADALLPTVTADTVIADKAYDAQARVIDVLAQAAQVAVIPPIRSRTAQRPWDRDLYKARHLIEHDQLLLYCQPKLKIASAQVCGTEALVRWQHARLGQVNPGEFIALAEQTGLITPLTYWMLEAVLRHSYAWHEQGGALPLSVNLSARDLHDPKLLGRIEGALATSGAPSRIGSSSSSPKAR